MLIVIIALIILHVSEENDVKNETNATVTKFQKWKPTAVKLRGRHLVNIRPNCKNGEIYDFGLKECLEVF